MVLRDVLAGLQLKKVNCDLELPISVICHDSRRVSPGALFVAISGYMVDGNRFVDSALAAGAVAVVTERPVEGTPYIQVEDAREALAVIAANFQRHPAREMVMIGVTGTNGKTTSTYLLKHLLELHGAKVGLIGTNQNMIGEQVLHTDRTTPEPNGLHALLREMADAGCTHVVMEVSSHSLVLHRVHGIEFEVGIFTNVSQDHLDFHKTMEAYIEAKSRLFFQCKKGVINLDDDAAQAMMRAPGCQYVTYSAKKNEADVLAKNVRLKARGIAFEAVCDCDIARIELPIPGEFSVYNALCVVAAAHAMGISLQECARGLRTAHGVKGRAEVVPTDTDYTVMIDYAHSPGGLENILKTVRGFAEGRVIVVFGCGGDRDAAKRPIMGRVASELADVLVVTSDNPRSEDPQAIIDQILPGITKKKENVYVEPNRPRAIHYALEHARAGDVVVLAGKGHETYQEICGVKHHLDEREVIAEYFAQR